MTDPAEQIRSLLILGGARSGKSRLAQKLAQDCGLAPVLIATAQALDTEMADRIARHAAARDSRWRLVEEPLALAETLRREAAPDRILVVDCMTLWLSNLLLRGDDIAPRTGEIARTVRDLQGPVVLVSNEVGGGIVPDNPLGRAFRDAQGALNQTLAESCDAVVLVSAGLATRLKPSPQPNFRF